MSFIDLMQTVFVLKDEYFFFFSEQFFKLVADKLLGEVRS